MSSSKAAQAPVADPTLHLTSPWYCHGRRSSVADGEVNGNAFI